MIDLKTALEYKQAIDEYNKANLPPEIKEDYHLTDLGNAQRIKDTFGDDIRHCHPTKEWVVWDNQRWNTDKQAFLEETCARGIVKQLYDEALATPDYKMRGEKIKFALKSESAPRIAGMIELAKSEPGIPILPNVLDKDPMLFNVQNGTIDLRTGKLKPHSKADFISKISPVVYDPDATCPRWMQFLNETFDGKKNIIEYLQRKAGYILTGDTSEEEFDQYYGTGDNGKSKYVNEISYIMGDYHVRANIETIQATSNRTAANAASSDVARLKGARFVTVSEPEKGTYINEQRVKDWTGRDPITARHLYQEPITFPPEFKFCLITNYKVRIKGTDNGIWRRVKLVPFEVTVPEELRDTHLDQKLVAESSGILNWMIEGCLKWQKDGLKVPEEILEATREYREEQDYLGDFFKECCELNKSFECQFNEIFLVYQAYCKIFEMPTQGKRSFAETLLSKKFKKVPKEKGKFYQGFRTKLEIHKKYETLISDTGRVVADDMTSLTYFLETFLSELSYREFKQNTSDSSDSSGNQHPDNGNEEVKSAGHKANSSGNQHPDNENNPSESNVKRNLQMTELSTLLLRSKDVFEHEKGVINSTNIIKFSMWFCETYKPKWKLNGESGEYTPSAIRGIASKLFKLTPEPGVAP